MSASSGRSHSILVGSNGRVWTAGLNSLGQVRSPSTVPQTPLTLGKYAVRAHALPGSQLIQARERASSPTNWRTRARRCCRGWHHIHTVPHFARKEHVMSFFREVPGLVADDGSQYTPAEVERRDSSEMGVRESTLRRGTGLDLTSKANPVRNFPRILSQNTDSHGVCSSCQGFR